MFCFFTTLATTYTYYDAFGDRLKSVHNNMGGKNHLEYDVCGRLSAASPTGFDSADSYGFMFKYNEFNEPYKESYEQYLLSGSSANRAQQLLARTDTNYDANTITAKQYRIDQNSPDEIVTTLDKYGRTSGIKEKSFGGSEKTTTFTRQINGKAVTEGWEATPLRESDGAAEVAEMWDPYEKCTYKYSYDDSNKPTGYEAGGYFGVTRTEADTVKYNLGVAKLASQTARDEECLLNPRVTFTTDALVEKVLFTPTEDSIFVDTLGYKYDTLGRLSGKGTLTKKQIEDAIPTPELKDLFFNGMIFKMIKNRKKMVSLLLKEDIRTEYKYQFGTTLKNKITTTLNKSGTDETYELSYGYDDNSRGLIASETLRKNGSALSTASYTYDNANRLKKESKKTGLNGSEYYSGEYTYNADGSIDTEIVADTKTPASTHSRKYLYPEKGRLGRYYNTSGAANTVYFDYDNIGNCTHYSMSSEIDSDTEPNMIWERGSLLREYTDANAVYGYNNQGVRYKKTVDGSTTQYMHDGAKLIAETRSNGLVMLKYIYDAEGISGFIMSDGAGVGFTEYFGKPELIRPYRFVKDAGGNVKAILSPDGEVARYEYDAWGKCRVLNPNGTENTSPTFIGNINPYRWKSYYYDTESELYYIDGRYYSPEIRQYLSPVNPESMAARAAVIYGLNPYMLCLTNPVNMGYNGYTIDTNSELAFDPPKLNAWNRFWRSTFGKQVAILLFVAATVAAVFTGGATLVAYFIAMGMVAGQLLIGGIQAGRRSYRQGKGWANGFANYINGNWACSVAIASALFLITLGISKLVAMHKNAGAKQQLASAKQEAVKALDDGVGFDTFDELKSYLKEQGIDLTGKEVHHIVEQNQIGKSGFSPKQIHNTNNVVLLDKTTHGKISGYYSSKDAFTQNLRVRNWLAGQSFQAQYDFGIKQLSKLGVII